MSSYKITNYSRMKAKELGVIIKPSSKKHKKIDLFKGDKRLASIGARGYTDYSTLKKTNNTLAEKKKRLYHARHKNNNGLAGKYAKSILW